MFRKQRLSVLLVGLMLFLLARFAYGAKVGRALDEALQSRATSPIEAVIANFQNAAVLTTNPAQKASVLSLLAQFLMEKKELYKAIEVYERILTEGAAADKPGAYYGEAQACLLLNQPEKAKAICAKLKADYPNSAMEEFSKYMSSVEPASIHAKLAGFFAEAAIWQGTAAVPRPLEPKPAETAPKATATAEKPLTTLPPTETQGARQPAIEQSPEDNRLTIGVKGWQSGLAGHFDSKGMSLDLNYDASISNQTKLNLYGSWQFTDNDRLRFDYFQFDHNGNLAKAVTFDKLLYTPGASVKLRTGFFDVGLSRLLDGSEHGSWKFLYGVKFSRSFMRLAQQTNWGTRAGELNQNFSVPYLGLEGNARLSGNVALNGSVKYFSLNKSGANGRLTDFDVALLFGRDYAGDPVETEWYGALGYRFFLLHGEADNDSVGIRYSGTTFGLESRF